MARLYSVEHSAEPNEYLGDRAEKNRQEQLGAFHHALLESLQEAQSKDAGTRAWGIDMLRVALKKNVFLLDDDTPTLDQRDIVEKIQEMNDTTTDADVCRIAGEALQHIKYLTDTFANNADIERHAPGSVLGDGFPLTPQ